MLKKTIKFIDYDGNPREEDFYFNLTKAELSIMEMSHVGGFRKKMERIIKAQDGPALIEAFQDIIQNAYGVKSDDGRRFIKSPELFEEFKQTEAYSELIMELLGSEKGAAEFIAQVMPQDVVAEAAAEKAANVTPIGG